MFTRSGRVERSRAEAAAEAEHEGHPEAVARWITQHHAGLAARISDETLHRRPDLRGGIGSRACDLMSIADWLDQLGAAVDLCVPELFAECFAWASAALVGSDQELQDRFDQDITVHLEAMRAVLARELPLRLRRRVLVVLDQALGYFPTIMRLGGCGFITPGAPLAGLAERYLAALVRSNRHEAAGMILSSARAGTGVRDIYLEVFQPVACEIGRLRQQERIALAEEHFCTATTQQVMGQLAPYIFGKPRVNHRLVATCVAGDLHELGLRMVADLFEIAGWDTFYMGANIPPEDVVSLAIERRAEVVAIAAALASQVPAVVDLIDRIHGDPRAAGVRVLVGGRPFNSAPELWRTVGADGHARAADEAVLLGRGLVEEPR